MAAGAVAGELPAVRVQEAGFDVGAELGALLRDAGTGAGGIGCFVGVVRADGGAPGSALVALELEHYPAMTQPALAAIAADARERFGLRGCRLVHRVGRLAVGEPIVLVLAAAAHRGEALEATGFLIDWLKTRAPFWKCQEFADGTRSWVEAREADEAAAACWDLAGADGSGAGPG